MYKNQRPRVKRLAAAPATQIEKTAEIDKFQNKDLLTKSQEKSEGNNLDKPSANTGATTSGRSVVNDEEPQRTTLPIKKKSIENTSSEKLKKRGPPARGFAIHESSSESEAPRKEKKSTDNRNSENSKKSIPSAKRAFVDDSSTDDDVLQKEKTVKGKKSNVNLNVQSAPSNRTILQSSSEDERPQVKKGKGKKTITRSSKKVVPTKEKISIDTSSSENDLSPQEKKNQGEVNKSKELKKITPTSANSPSNLKSAPLAVDKSSGDKSPQVGKGKGMGKKTVTRSSKKVVPTKEKISIDTSSSENDLSPQEKKKQGEVNKSKELKKITPTSANSPCGDESPQVGKGKEVGKKTITRSSKRVISATEKISIDTSSSEDELSPQEKKKVERKKSKGLKKTTPSSKKITLDESSTDDDILQNGKGKSLQTKKLTKNSGQIVTSTQKSTLDDSSTDVDEPPRGQKRSGENMNGNEPAVKRTQTSTTNKFADFATSSPAISSICSPASSPEKRSRIQAGLARKKTVPAYMNTIRPQTGNPLFDQLGSFGFTFGEGEEPNCLDRDQASFVRSLDTALRNDKKYPQNVDDFVQHFETFMTASMENLGRVLETTQSSDDFARKSVQECLMRLLLNVDCVQPKLWGILLAKISELIIDEEEEQANFEMLHRIMRQMRCLDRVIKGDVNICDQLFVILELATKEDTKREIILLLPDVISEEDHEKAAQIISDSLSSNHPLIPAYLDTLSSLVLCEETNKDMVERLIKLLGRADTKYFQIIIKYLVVTTNNLEPVIRGIRQHLDLDPGAYGNDGNEGIMLASTLKEVENKKALIVTWMELVEEAEPQQWLAVDFVALLVNHSKVKAPVMAAFKKLAARCAEGEKDVEKVYPAIKSILEYDYLDTVRQILDNLFKSRAVLESRHAAFWYRFLLNNIETSHVSQKILDDVMSHIGHSSGNPAEVSLALNSLIDAANKDKNSVVRHTQRILTLMYNLESWPLPQVRQVINLLLSLVYHNDEAAGMQDIMTIAIRKHLNHPSFL